MKARTDLLNVNDTDYLCPKTILSFDLLSLLKRKGLNATLFEPINCTITLDAEISDHAAWVFRHIYTVPYSNQTISQEGILRFYHGIQHVSRAAIYAPIFANLYRRHGHHLALELTNEEIKLIQIALLFHDSAREDEEEDLWDHESATFLYFYLTRILKVSSQKAKALAEAVANKDWVTSEPYLVLFEMDGEVFWSLEKGCAFSRTIYQTLIHDSDCLDIIRARAVFKGKKLYFYQDIVCLSNQKTALEEMAELIIRARSLIEIQGDGRGRMKPTLKKYYENENAYLAILDDIASGDYIIFEVLYANGALLSSEQLAKLVLIDENNPLNQQRILARGIITPTAVAPLKNKNSQACEKESFASLEFRKARRRQGVLTNTSKSDGLNKEGNPSRSVSLLGGGVFADVGCLLFTPDEKAIKAVYAVDADTGWGKKQAISAVTITLDALATKMKKGGSVRFFKGSKYTATHNEMLYDINAFDAIYFTYDPTFANAVFHGTPENTELYSPILKAIYLQLAYAKAFDGTVLPIYEYSGIHHYLKKVDSFTQTQISDMWLAMCKNYMTRLIEIGAIKKLSACSVNDIMIYSLYKKIRKTEFYTEVTNGCSEYPEQLMLAIEKRISEARDELIANHHHKVKRKLIDSVKKLVPANDLTYEISKQLIQDFKSAAYNDDLPSSQIIGLTYVIYTFIKIKLTKIHQNCEGDLRDALFPLISLACGVGLVSEFKTELSTRYDCRWITYRNDEIDYNKPLYVSELMLILHSLYPENSKIDLGYLSILEICYGDNSQFIFLNAVFRHNDLLRRHFFGDDAISKPQSPTCF